MIPGIQTIGGRDEALASCSNSLISSSFCGLMSFGFGILQVVNENKVIVRVLSKDTSCSL